MVKSEKINAFKNRLALNSRYSFWSGKIFLRLLFILNVVTLGYSQDYYGEVPYYVNPQLNVGNSYGDVSGYPGEISGTPLDVPLQFWGENFPTYPQTVDGYVPSMRFQEGSVYSQQPLPQNFGATLNSNMIQGADGQYQILGDVTTSIPIGNSQFDNIPVLEDSHINETPKLPELKVPQNESQFIDRVDALAERFSKLPLSAQRSTPGRLLRYSLIGGADQTFLAPQTTVQSTGEGETTSQSELKPIFAIGALCWNYPCSNRRILRDLNGKPVPTVGFGFQSQRGELLSTLAFARIDRNYELRVDSDKKYTVQDLVEWEKYSCSTYANLSLVAIGLAHYSQNPDETWINSAGETWSLARILAQESQRPIDWETAESTDKLLAFTYLLARLKTSADAETPQLSEALKRTEAFLVAVKNRVWEIVGDKALSNSLFFKKDVELTTPYMTLYVNGKLLRWVTLVSSPEEMSGDRMKRAMFELCALVDQLFNSVNNLDVLSATDEESLAVAMQTLIIYRRFLASSAR